METRNGKDLIADKKRFNILGDHGYYIFDPGESFDDRPLVSFIGLNSDTLPDDSKQVAWLSKTLTDDQAFWKIPFFHHPLYTPEGGHEDEEDVRQEIEHVLIAAGVKITFAGHNHFYARSKPQNGVVHFVTGGGGRKLNTPSPDDRIEKAVRDYHFVYVELRPAKLDFWAVSPSRGIIDNGSIRQSIPAAPTSSDEAGG
jgi:hypothetical protein